MPRQKPPDLSRPLKVAFAGGEPCKMYLPFLVGDGARVEVLLEVFAFDKVCTEEKRAIVPGRSHCHHSAQALTVP